MDPGTAKEEHRATNSPDNNVAIDGDHGLEPESAQKSSSISTGGLDGGCGKLDSVKNAETDTAGDVDDEAAVELPDSIQKKRIIRVPSVSRKGQRAIGACIFSIAVGIAVGIYFGFRLTHSGGISVEGLPVDLCGTTLYPDICNSTLFGTDTTTPRSYVSKSMSVSATSTNITLGSFNQCLLASGPSLFPGSRQYSTLQMCVEMSQATLFAETTFLATLNSVDTDQPGVAVVNDLEQRASAALTYHFTCVNELEAQGLWRDGGGAICGVDLERSTALLSNALSLVGTFKNANETVAVPSRRRLLNFSRRGKATSVPKASRRMLSPMDVDESRPPPWPLNPIDRRILQSSSSNNNNITPNAVVALDGSGDFTSVQAAVDHAPSNSSQRYVIYIKAGTYDERVRVPEDKLRLTLVGDGAGTTIVTGNASSGAQNVSALFTATVSK